MLRIWVDASTYKNRLCLHDELLKKNMIEYAHKDTINVLEYKAILKGLEYINKIYPNETVQLFSDSKLVVNQLHGTNKINNMSLLESCFECKEIWPDNVKILWTPRTRNKAGIHISRLIRRDKLDSI